MYVFMHICMYVCMYVYMYMFLFFVYIYYVCTKVRMKKVIKSKIYIMLKDDFKYERNNIS